MLKKAGTPTRKIDLQANVTVDAIAFSVITNLVEPDVALLNAIQGSLKQLIRCVLKEVRVNVKATLYPSKIRSGSLDKLKSIRVRIIEVTHYSPIFVYTAAPQGFIKGRVDAGKGDGARRCKSFSVFIPTRTELTKMHSNASSITKSVGDETPGSLNTFRAFHAVLNNEDRTADGEA
jgi:hypothetical protein